MKIVRNQAGYLTVKCSNNDESEPTRELELKATSTHPKSKIYYEFTNSCLELDWGETSYPLRATVTCRAKRHPIHGWQEVQGTIVGADSIQFV